MAHTEISVSEKEPIATTKYVGNVCEWKRERGRETSHEPFVLAKAPHIHMHVFDMVKKYQTKWFDFTDKTANAQPFQWILFTLIEIVQRPHRPKSFLYHDHGIMQKWTKTASTHTHIHIFVTEPTP